MEEEVESVSPFTSLVVNNVELVAMILLQIDDPASIVRARFTCKGVYHSITEEEFINQCDRCQTESTLIESIDLHLLGESPNQIATHTRLIKHLPSGVLHGEFQERIYEEVMEFDLATHTFLNENRTILLSGRFHKGRQHGKWSVYENGEKMAKVRYNNGVRRNSRTWGLWSTSSIFEEESNQKFVTEEGRYSPQGERTGEWRSWRSPGVLHTSRMYNNGMLDGLMTCYLETGKVLFTRMYRNGDLIVEDTVTALRGAMVFASRFGAGRLKDRRVPAPSEGTEKTSLVYRLRCTEGVQLLQGSAPNGSVVDTVCSWIPEQFRPLG